MAARPKPWRVPERFWVEVEPLIPRVERRFRYPGRKRHDDRACLEGILYVLRYAVPWQELPRQEGWPSGQTCWRRFHEWQRAGVWARLLLRMQELLEQEAWPTGRARSSTPRWSMRKRGRPDRPLLPGSLRKPLPPSRRRARRPLRDQDRAGQRERAAPPAAARRRAARTRAQPRRAVGRPRLCLGRAGG